MAPEAVIEIRLSVSETTRAMQSLLGDVDSGGAVPSEETRPGFVVRGKKQAAAAMRDF
ncbi:MAG: hypothetical protein R2748_16245 [Bryobacterales bacterium]